MGLIVAVPSFARAMLNLPMGYMVDVIGRKVPMIVGAVIDAAGCFATALAGGMHSMVAARLLMGSGSAVATAASEACMHCLFPCRVVVFSLMPPLLRPSASLRASVDAAASPHTLPFHQT